MSSIDCSGKQHYVVNIEPELVSPHQFEIWWKCCCSADLSYRQLGTIAAHQKNEERCSF